MQEKNSVFQSVRMWLSAPENRTRALLTLRYLFPLIWAVTLGVLGFLYNIRAGNLRLSLWHLLFNTVKQGRGALLAGNITGAQRGYYILLLVGAFLAAVALLAALILAVLALYTYFVATDTKREAEERRQAKIFFRAVFRGRISLYLSNLLLLFPALFPLYFCVVSNRHPGGGFITLGFDPVLTVSLVLAFLLALLCVYLAGREREKFFDMFYIEPEAEADEADADAEMEDLPE